MVVLYILGVLLVLFGALSFLPLEVIFRVGTAQKFSVTVRAFGINFGGEEESRNPAVRYLQKLVKRKQSSSVSPKKEKQKTGTAGVKGHLDLLASALNALFGLLRRCHVSRCEVHGISGGDDAAIHYGEICAAVYPFVGYLQNNRRLRKRKTQLDIGWDYDRPDSVVDITVAVRVRTFFLITAALPMLFQHKKRKGDSV